MSRLAKYFLDAAASTETVVASQESAVDTGAVEITNVPSTESLEAAKEFMEARSGIEDITSAEQQLSVVTESIGSFKATLENFNQQGGVSQEAAPMFENALNVAVMAVGIPAISLGFKNDEFNEENPRQVASFEQLNVVEGMLAAASEQLVTARQDAEKRLTVAALNFSPEVISTESFAGISQELTGAEEISQNEVRQSVVQAVKPLRDAIVASNENGGLGMEALLAVSMGAEAFAKLLARGPLHLIGVEEIKAAGNVLSVEELDAVCAEPTIDLNAGLDTTGNAAAAEVPAGDPAKPEAASGPEILEGETPEMFDGEGTLTESEVLELLTENGDDEDVVVEVEVGTDAEPVTDYSAEDLAAGALSAVKAQMMYVKIAELEKTIQKQKSEIGRLKSALRKSSNVSAEMLEILHDEDEVSQEGLKDIFRFITSREARLEWSVKQFPAQVEESQKIIDELKAAIAKAKKEERPIQVRELTAELELWQEELADIKESNTYFVSELKKAQNRKAELAKLKAANTRSVKGKQVSSESVEVSMEADIKDLKSGKKVKYSHGHGKVVKMFTAPFKHGKKEHKASKETPFFLVKADKGGHYSIHKASALTLV